MDKLQLMSVFVAVAEEQGFAAAARRMGMSAPAVTRAVAALEEGLQVRLLARTTRHVRVTEAGQRYLEDARRILADIRATEETVAGISASPRGHLTVTAPVLFGRMYVMPGIVEFLQRFPDMDVSALFLDRVVNLQEESIDVGIRIGELPDSGLKALRVASVSRVLCASPQYLEQMGVPQHPSSLQQHRIIASTGISMETQVAWRFHDPAQERNVLVKIAPRLTVNSNDASISACLAGLGVARLMSYQVGALIAGGQLVRILREYELPPVPVHILHHEDRYAAAKVRSFVDLMAGRLRASAALLASEAAG